MRARDRQGVAFGGNDMLMSPRGLARFGELYRNGGRVDGRQIHNRLSQLADTLPECTTMMVFGTLRVRVSGATFPNGSPSHLRDADARDTSLFHKKFRSKTLHI